MAQKSPLFRDIVDSSLHFDKNEPCAVQIMAAPTPRRALTAYSSHVFGHKNDIMNALQWNTIFHKIC
jgi:hypothetical protein